MQHKTLEKFLLDDYELVVFNDARDPKANSEIIEICTTLNLRCFRVPQEVHDRPYLDRVNNPEFVAGYNAPSVRN